MKKIFKSRYVINGMLLISGIFLGWLFFRSSHEVSEKTEIREQDNKPVIWTCSMHPHIRMEAPGKCPICGMDLIPLGQSTENVDPAAIHFTKEAAALANVVTSVVSKQKPVKQIRLNGKILADERYLQSQVAHFSGRIEKLYVNFTGEFVRKGQVIASLYSPELISAQQELLETFKTKQSQPEIYKAAREKLRQWKLTDSQVDKIEATGNILENMDIVSEMSGVVTEKKVNKGDYVSRGSVFYTVADLSIVWVVFDAYETDLPFLTEGEKIDFTVQALPGKTYSGKIAFIDPVIDPLTRVSKVRLEMRNTDGKFKPEMFVSGIANTNLTGYSDKLLIPGTAVLWTGKRSIVYVKQAGTDEPIFKMREIELGPELGNGYVVISGLNEGEEIVTQGTFSVDAAAQLEGKPSMMNPQGGEPTDGHDHSTMQKTIDKHSGHNMQTLVQHEIFSVSGNCDMCKERIETAAKSVKGVSAAGWDQNTKKIQVEFNNTKTSLNDIQEVIAKAGHDTEKFKADDKTYESLPECCKYRN